MWYSPIYLQEYSRERSRELSALLAKCRLAEEYGRPPPPGWRSRLARHLAGVSLRLDRKAALAALDDSTARTALEAGLFLR